MKIVCAHSDIELVDVCEIFDLTHVSVYNDGRMQQKFVDKNGNEYIFPYVNIGIVSDSVFSKLGIPVL
ncbi:hypothetical protein HNP86_002010 [Methanococcus maripaludis]|uniref:Uncharacterized protein n=1 Tax=Methanococcus maripaludis TaxID=39152 RepID=A0A7J9NX27_METMI|nr:hypothetical protein [Methanococcus maripaludis]MBA2851851.1 hypothetical protein [Methanococcus maripaludis]